MLPPILPRNRPFICEFIYFFTLPYIIHKSEMLSRRNFFQKRLAKPMKYQYNIYCWSSAGIAQLVAQLIRNQ